MKLIIGSFLGSWQMDPNKKVSIWKDGYWEEGVNGVPFDHYGSVLGIISFYPHNGKVTVLA